MKILLLGELSGLHRELRHGFDLLNSGDEVVTAVKTTRGADIGEINFYASRHTGKRQVFEDIWEQLRKFGKLKGFDIVQIITPKFFNWHLHDYLMDKLVKGNHASVMINTGCSNDYNEIARSLPYAPCADCKKFDLPTGACVYERPEEKQLERAMYARVDGIVSTCHEYTMATHHAGFGSKNINIALPVDFKESEAKVLRFENDRPIEVFYGETRYGYKGSRFILAALERLSAAMPGRHINITRAKNLPFQEYKRVLDKADVVIDQCNALSYGMNALYSLAKGKVVLSGNEPWHLKHYPIPYDDCPVININPDEQMIFDQLYGLLNDRARLVSLSAKSIDFVRKYHESSVIASQYLQFYKEVLAGKKNRS